MARCALVRAAGEVKMISKFLSALAGTAVLATGAWAQQSSNAQKVQTQSIRYPNANIDREYGTKVLLSGENQMLAELGTANEVATCLARRAKDKGGELLGGPMTDDPEFKQLTRALKGKYSNCSSSKPVPLILINGALAEQLIRMKQPSLQARAAVANAAAAKAFYATNGGVTIDSLGRCLAVYSPGLAYRVLATGAGSPTEAQALSQLYAQTPECGVRAAPRDITSVEQRTAVAAGLYHWLNKG